MVHKDFAEAFGSNITLMGGRAVNTYIYNSSRLTRDINFAVDKRPSEEQIKKLTSKENGTGWTLFQSNQLNGSAVHKFRKDFAWKESGETVKGSVVVEVVYDSTSRVLGIPTPAITKRAVKHDYHEAGFGPINLIDKAQLVVAKYHAVLGHLKDPNPEEREKHARDIWQLIDQRYEGNPSRFVSDEWPRVFVYLHDNNGDLQQLRYPHNLHEEKKRFKNNLAAIYHGELDGIQRR